VGGGGGGGHLQNDPRQPDRVSARFATFDDNKVLMQSTKDIQRGMDVFVSYGEQYWWQEDNKRHMSPYNPHAPMNDKERLEDMWGAPRPDVGGGGGSQGWGHKTTWCTQLPIGHCTWHGNARGW
jgi:hypothetical protein